MTEPKPKKRHHYLPVFYLNGFTDNNGCLYVYDKESKSVFESSPEGVAYENDYFSYITPEGEKDSETVENFIGELEGEFAKPLKKILNSEPLLDDERITFAYFIASMMVRVPNFRDNIRKGTGEALKHINTFIASNKESFERMMSKKGDEMKGGMSLEAFRQFMLNPDNYKVDVNPQYATGMALWQMESMAKVFYDMKWAFIRATDDYKFMTGDNPLKYIDPTHNPRSFYGVGLLNKNVEVSLPLSKEVCAFGSWKYREGYAKVSNNHIRHLNKMTVTATRRHVFADKKSDDIDKFVKKYKGSHPVMRVG